MMMNMGDKKKTSRLKLGLSIGISYLILSAVLHWRDFDTSDWILASINAVGLIVESALFGLFFTIAFPPVSRFVAGRIAHKQTDK
jgi:hypothetical protein